MMNVTVDHVENGYDAEAFRAAVSVFPGGLARRARGLVASWYHAPGSEPYCTTVFEADGGPRDGDSGIWCGPSKTAGVVARGSVDGHHGTWHLERARGARPAPYAQAAA